MTVTTEFRTAALAAEALELKVYDNAVGLGPFVLNFVAEMRTLAESCAAREDYVGAWIAYGRSYLAIQEGERFSLLKRDEHGQIF